jgi:hypothetical protein
LACHCGNQLTDIRALCLLKISAEHCCCAIKFGVSRSVHGGIAMTSGVDARMKICLRCSRLKIC